MLNAVILPPAMLGLLGGGQLGRLFVLAAKSCGYRVSVLDPDPQAPAADVADEHICAAYNDSMALARLKDSCEAITIEFENVDVQAMAYLANFVPVIPPPQSVAISQDRIQEKAFCRRIGLPTAPYHEIISSEDLKRDLQAYFPGRLKVARCGYDGRGQYKVPDAAALGEAYRASGEQPCILEKQLPLAKELSVIVVRSQQQQTAVFPVAENQHINGILDTSMVPANIPASLAQQAQAMALQLVDALAYVGVLAVEFFVLADGRLLVNEMAPRPHNSGHYTIDACLSSQYEQQLRMMCGFDPAQTDLLMSAVMVNLLGEAWHRGTPNWQTLLACGNVKLYLYGKTQARPGRKMAHFTVLAKETGAAYQQAQQLKHRLEATA